jgi:ketosteroid isomerase-like protein
MKTAIAVALMLLMSISLAIAEDTPEQVFRDLENRIARAVMTKDATEMNKLFASDYTSVGIYGRIRSKAEVIEASSSGRLAISAAQVEKLTVRQYGDVAIVVGFVKVSGKDGATDVSGRYAITRVYKRDSGDWHAVSFQATLEK